MFSAKWYLYVCVGICACAFSLLPVDRAAAEFVGLLDGSSVQSTFYNGPVVVVNNTTLPLGWIEFLGDTRVYGSPTLSPGSGYGVIHATGKLVDFSVVYDTQTPIQADTEYLLSVDLGFQSPNNEHGVSGNYQVEIGTWDGSTSTFTSLATKFGTVVYSGYGFEAHKSGSDSLNLTTGGSVTGQNVAVRLARVAGGDVNWQGFDNIVLTADPIPEPSMLVMLGGGLLGLLAYAWRKRR